MVGTGEPNSPEPSSGDLRITGDEGGPEQMRQLRRRIVVTAAAPAVVVVMLGVPLASASATLDATESLPTPEPTVSSEPTPEPTSTPTPTPTPSTTTAPQPSPTAPSAATSPEPSPAPEPGQQHRVDPDLAYTQALEGAQTVAVAEAQRLLQLVLAEIDAAQAVLDQSTAEAEAARAADAAAQEQLAIAEASAARTEREIVEISARAEQTRHTLSDVAVEAYQGDSLASLGVVLRAETPKELADRYVGLRTVLQANDAALGDLAVEEANLRNAQARLEGQREERQKLADQAAATRAVKETAEQAAQEAKAVLEGKGDKYEYALSLAEQARLDDYQRYMELLNESTALGEALATADYGPGYGSGTFVRPGTAATTSAYGPRLHPILDYVKTHTGLDFGFGDGNIYAADSGTVVTATWNQAYGNMVVIDHGEVNGQRLTTMYAHQPGLMVTEGQRVEKGQVIGRIGSTGYSTGPHLHFEVRLDGQHTDPWPWVKDAPAPR